MNYNQIDFCRRSSKINKENAFWTYSDILESIDDKF